MYPKKLLGILDISFVKQETIKNTTIVIKRFLIFLLIIILIVGLYASTVIVKKINVSKLGDEYCEYNGEHPIETGMKGETHSTCKGCSKLMRFDYRITDELCETCTQELHRCKRCGKLLKD